MTWVESPADLGLSGMDTGHGKAHVAKDAAGFIAPADSKRQFVPVGVPGRPRSTLGGNLLAAFTRVRGRYK